MNTLSLIKPPPTILRTADDLSVLENAPPELVDPDGGDECATDAYPSTDGGNDDAGPLKGFSQSAFSLSAYATVVRVWSIHSVRILRNAKCESDWRSLFTAVKSTCERTRQFGMVVKWATLLFDAASELGVDYESVRTDVKALVEGCEHKNAELEKFLAPDECRRLKAYCKSMIARMDEASVQTERDEIRELMGTEKPNPNALVPILLLVSATRKCQEAIRHCSEELIREVGPVESPAPGHNGNREMVSVIVDSIRSSYEFEVENDNGSQLFCGSAFESLQVRASKVDSCVAEFLKRVIEQSYDQTTRIAKETVSELNVEHDACQEISDQAFELLEKLVRQENAQTIFAVASRRPHSYVLWYAQSLHNSTGLSEKCFVPSPQTIGRFVEEYRQCKKADGSLANAVTRHGGLASFLGKTVENLFCALAMNSATSEIWVIRPVLVEGSHCPETDLEQDVKKMLMHDLFLLTTAAVDALLDDFRCVSIWFPIQRWWGKISGERGGLVLTVNRDSVNAKIDSVVTDTSSDRREFGPDAT